MKEIMKSLAARLNRRGTTGAAFAGALVAVVLGLVLYGPIKTYVNDSKDGGSNDSLLDLIPTFWVISCLGVAVAMGIAAFKGR